MQMKGFDSAGLALLGSIYALYDENSDPHAARYKAFELTVQVHNMIHVLICCLH